MDNYNETMNKIYDSTYCINATTKQIFFIFFKSLIERYLADVKQYNIVVSTTNSLMIQYQQYWPSHMRLQYLSDGFIPTNIPTNTKVIYFYHQPTKPSKQEQLDLVNYLHSHPDIKYIYVGAVHKLLSHVYNQLFNYYLHFEVRATRWNRIHASHLIGYSIGRSICRKYFSQLDKKKAIKSMTMYDYCVVINTILDESEIVKFNKKIFTPKKPKNTTNNNTNITVQPVNNSSNNNTSSQPEQKTKIRYVYLDSISKSDHLIMPDGSMENYKQIIDKYQDVIEI